MFIFFQSLSLAEPRLRNPELDCRPSMIVCEANANDKYTRKNTHYLSGIRTHGHSVQSIKAYALDCAATLVFDRLIHRLNVLNQLFGSYCSSDFSVGV
jgi:hypothetical protein